MRESLRFRTVATESRTDFRTEASPLIKRAIPVWILLLGMFSSAHALEVLLLAKTRASSVAQTLPSAPESLPGDKAPRRLSGSSVGQNPRCLTCRPATDFSCLRTARLQLTAAPDPLSLVELLRRSDVATTTMPTPGCPDCESQLPGSTAPLFVNLGVLAPQSQGQEFAIEYTSPPSPFPTDGPIYSIHSSRTALLPPLPTEPGLWHPQSNGSDGALLRLSAAHALQINPAWLDFSLFDSMNLNITDQPPGPGESEPQLWRSTFTAGVGADWHFTRTLALHAGYRFYENPMPEKHTSGALLNASQQVMATALSWQDGPHSLALAYGLNLLSAANPAGISSARYGENLDSMAHLVSFTYGYSF